jgi:hypothetical protein
MNTIKFEENNGGIVEKLGLTEQRADEIQEFVCDLMAKYEDLAEVMDLMQAMCNNQNELAFSNYRIGKCANCPSRLLKDMIKDGNLEGLEGLEELVDLGSSKHLKDELDKVSNGTNDGDTKIVNGEINLRVTKKAVIERLTKLINISGGDKQMEEYIDMLQKGDVTPQLIVLGQKVTQVEELLLIYSVINDKGQVFLIETTNVKLGIVFLKDNLPHVIGPVETIRTITLLKEKYEEIINSEPTYGGTVTIGRDANGLLFDLIDMNAIAVVKEVERGEGGVLTKFSKEERDLGKPVYAFTFVDEKSQLVIVTGDSKIALQEALNKSSLSKELKFKVIRTMIAKFKDDLD